MEDLKETRRAQTALHLAPQTPELLNCSTWLRGANHPGLHRPCTGLTGASPGGDTLPPGGYTLDHRHDQESPAEASSARATGRSSTRSILALGLSRGFGPCTFSFSIIKDKL